MPGMEPVFPESQPVQWRLCANLAHIIGYDFDVPDNYTPKNSKNLCGSKIRNAREEHVPAITQDQLAGKLAVLGLVLDRTAIAKIELGQRCVYDYELGAFACALDVEISSLVQPNRTRRK